MLKSNKQILTDKPASNKALRLLPGVIILILQWLVRFGVPVVLPEHAAMGVLGGLAGGLAIVVWWAFFSRASRIERWGAVVLMIAAMVATSHIVHESLRTGMQGMMFFLFCIPVLSLSFVIWAVASRRLSDLPRRVMMVATILLTCGAWTLVRSDGITGNAGALFAWRWSETAEERLLSQPEEKPGTLLPAQPISETGADWSGFRGPNRDGIIHGLQIITDWSESPPAELWRRPIGPGCSSFAVQGDLLFTQEQRGENEVVACYHLTSGEPVWKYHYAARFWDSHAGAGPRSTPTLSGSRVYTLGATGILNVLKADNGDLVWTRNAASDTEVELRKWGFTSSPLVVDELVIVAIAGKLVAYDIDTGEPRWFEKNGNSGYSSPHLLRIDGVPQVLLMSGKSLTSVNPTDGRLLWKHERHEEEPIVQPAITADGDILYAGGQKLGMCCIGVKQGLEGWNIEERWSSVKLKPGFTDFVVHKGHAFGCSGPILTCIDVEDGALKWKGGRYSGQLLLLADQDLLLVLSEKGELALVEATPDQFTELAKFQAIEAKTWNHPVLIGNIILVRNAEEMAAFRIRI